MDAIWTKLLEQCLVRCEARGLGTEPDWPEFKQRLHQEFQRLGELLWALYGDRPDFAFQVEELLVQVFQSTLERPDSLKERDRRKQPESGWFLSEKMVGAVAYVDRFAGSFRAMEQRIPYLQELGVTYLHLMPFFRSPPVENDGGYAVSSYRETNPVLGSMVDLERLSQSLEQAGICLVADFIFNHTADDHNWAQRSQAGETEYQDYYWTFAEHSQTEIYQTHLRDIFPEVRKGSFTFVPAMNKWVWTSFNSFQWDLNYLNPAVFTAMAQEMIFLANRGIAVLRLDAVAFIWKQAGTNCENLPQAHTIIQAFQAIARLACPSLLFKSEAIVHPDDIRKYIDLRECQLSYNPLLMAELWEAAATKEVRLLAHSLRKRHHLPHGCAWINYVRCHDDIGWTFANEDAAELGIKGGDHRDFLNRFYLGEFPGSFSRGLSFQYNPQNGDRRICGSCASLAGLEQALSEGSGQDLETAIRRIILFYGIVFSAGGIPLIYLGDELATLNDYDYALDPGQAGDSRWVHRPKWSDQQAAQRKLPASPEARVFTAMVRLAKERSAHPVFGDPALTVLDSGHPSVLAFRKQHDGLVLTVIGNFAESPVRLGAQLVSDLLATRNGRDILTDRQIFAQESLELEAAELLWILSAQ